MIRIFGNFGPCVAWNIQYFSLICKGSLSTNSQWSFTNLCQSGPVVAVFCIGMIVKYKSIIAKLGNMKNTSYKITNLSQPVFFALAKQSKTRCSGKLYVPQAPRRNSLFRSPIRFNSQPTILEI